MAVLESKQVYEVKCTNPNCPSPHSLHRDGFHNNLQRYKCLSCGKKFAAEGKALRKQFTANQIAAAVDMYYSGMSYKQIAENMKDVFDVPEPSKQTVHSWVKGYTKLAKEYLDGEVGEDGTPKTATFRATKPKVGDHWVADEMFIKVGGRQMYLWNVMDRDTRYVLAARVDLRRDTDAAIRTFEEAKEAAQKSPQKITTDGLGSYVDAARAVFPRGTEHVVAEGIYSEVNNNIAERLQGTLRSRVKTQRGLQMRRTAQDYVNGFVIDYNHFKAHHTLRGKTPAQVTGVSSEVPWTSWEGVTRLGGEVAEPKLLEHKAQRRRPGRKPMPESVIEAFQQQIDKEKTEEARRDRKQSRRWPVGSYRPPKTGKTNNQKGGRGAKERRAANIR